ncbi:hypothetical protein SDJN02_04541, partial [Cucurbita argyrosperma subsp. argyrosperma]
MIRPFFIIRGDQGRHPPGYWNSLLGRGNLSSFADEHLLLQHIDTITISQTNFLGLMDLHLSFSTGQAGDVQNGSLE